MKSAVVNYLGQEQEIVLNQSGEWNQPVDWITVEEVQALERVTVSPTTIKVILDGQEVKIGTKFMTAHEKKAYYAAKHGGGSGSGSSSSSSPVTMSKEAVDRYFVELNKYNKTIECLVAGGAPQDIIDGIRKPVKPVFFEMIKKVLALDLTQEQIEMIQAE